MAEQDRYEPKERLATGLGGERWRALDTHTGTDVVLGVLDARTATPEERTRFAAVADAGTSLNHPGLEKVTDRGTTSLGNPYIVHELVDAPTFAKRMETHPPWSIHEVVRVGTSLLDALSVAHAAGLVHADVEPERVQVLPAGRARLTGFGLSRAAQRIAGDAWHASFAFMSPEQANGEPPTASSDVYGVGALIYRAITGIAPRAANDGSASRERIIDGPLVEVRTLRGEIPQALATAIERALAAEPKQRFASAAELRKALTSALILSPTVARMHVRATPGDVGSEGGARAAQRTPAPPRVAVGARPTPVVPRPAPKVEARGPKTPVETPKRVPAKSAISLDSIPPEAEAPAIEPPRMAAAAHAPVAPERPSDPDGEELDAEALEELEPEAVEVPAPRPKSVPPAPPLSVKPNAAPAAEVAPSTEAPAADAPDEDRTSEPTKLARVQVKQVNVARGPLVAEEQVGAATRRRDPRAERSDPPPKPVEPPAAEPTSAVAAPAPRPAPERDAPAAAYEDAPSPFRSEPPPPDKPSRAPLVAISLLVLGIVAAALGTMRHMAGPERATQTPPAAPARTIRQPIATVDAATAREPDAAVVDTTPDAGDDAAGALVTPTPVPEPTPVEPPPPTTAPTPMTQTASTAPMTTTTRPTTRVEPPTMTTVAATPMTTTSEMTAPAMTEPAMTAVMETTTMRHIEVDPGF